MDKNRLQSARHSITYRMTTTVGAFFVVFLSLIILLFMYYYKRDLKQTIFTHQKTLARVVAQDIDQKLIDVQKALVYTSELITPEILADSKRAEQVLENSKGIQSFFDHGIYLLSKEGKLIAEWPHLEERKGMDFSFREYYKNTIATGKPLISKPFIASRRPVVPVVGFTAPIRGGNGELIGILLGGINLLQDSFLGDVSRTQIGNSGFLVLFSNDGTIIIHPDKNRIMTDKIPLGVSQLLDKTVGEGEGTAERMNYRGEQALISLKRLKATDWVVGAQYPLAEAYKPIYRAEQASIAAIIICLLSSVVIIRFMMLRYTEALVRFANHVNEISFKKGAERLFALDSNDEIGVLAKTFNTLISRHDAQNEELKHISNHDSVTGLYNRTYFDEELKRVEHGRTAPVSVIMADLDGLKNCNDTYGHDLGDEMIRAAARVLMEAFRVEDVVARVGGDEFAILLPGVDAEHAEIAVKRVRYLVAKHAVMAENIPLSISIGAATAEHTNDLKEAVKKADKEMYQDKISRKISRGQLL